jgi:hypothetical protein
MDMCEGEGEALTTFLLFSHGEFSLAGAVDSHQGSVRTRLRAESEIRDRIGVGVGATGAIGSRQSLVRTRIRTGSSTGDRIGVRVTLNGRGQWASN